MLGLIRRWRRRRLMKEPIPPGWEGILRRHLPFYPPRDPSTRERFLAMLRAFVAEKHFFGAGGLEIDEEKEVVIGAVAVRLVLDLDLSHYDRLTEIVVYPYTWEHPRQTGGRLGEAHAFGTVVLSWPAVLAGLRDPHDGHDTGAHEFAHVLDRATGAFDGTPALHCREHYRPWAEVMSEHFLALRDHCDPHEVLRCYGATNEAEFFAVATEAFFETPDRLREEAPDLYDALRRFYHPAGSCESAGA
ncbi:MAG: M90 family metallopeptidase [Myxococcota bacterium]